MATVSNAFSLTFSGSCKVPCHGAKLDHQERWEWAPNESDASTSGLDLAESVTTPNASATSAGKLVFHGPRILQALRTTATGGRHREADSLSFGIQLAHKRAPKRRRKRRGQRLKKAEAALLAAQEAGLPQSFIDEFLQEVQSRRQERESRKQIGARRD